MLATGPGLLCSVCGSDQMEVKDSRPGPDCIRRRRQCPCGAPRVSTIEVMVPQGPRVNLPTVHIAAMTLMTLTPERRLLVTKLIHELGGDSGEEET